MPTRSAFVGKLAQLETLTLSALDLVAASLKRALAALEDRDAGLAQRVVADDDHIDRCYRDVNAGVLDLLATQAPVAMFRGSSTPLAPSWRRRRRSDARCRSPAGRGCR